MSPRLLENNDFDPSGSAALYFDNTPILPHAISLFDDVKTLPGSAGNISDDPRFVAYPTDLHLAGGSQCVNAGSSTDAPMSDFDGKTRSAPDIGAFER